MEVPDDIREVTLESRPVFRGEVLSLNLDLVRLPNGNKAEREWISHKGAVGIIAMDADSFLFVEQYRYPAGRIILEIPAGKLSEGEDPACCAIRELQEETGFLAGRVELLSTFYTTPGYSDEVFHMFLASDLQPGECSPEEDEFLRLVRIGKGEVLRMLDEDRFEDGKTIVGLALALRRLDGG